VNRPSPPGPAVVDDRFRFDRELGSERPGALRRTALALLVALLACPAVSQAALRSVVVGHSVRGRTIRAYVIGDPHSQRRILVVGCVHGDETAGIAIARRLRRARPPKATALWLVGTFNPDGVAAGTRQNAHGVDLNRNAPWRWRRLTGIFDSGPRPLSEPESRAINRLVRRLRPAVSIWYHQHAALVDDSGGDARVERRYARLVGLRFRRFGRPTGSVTSWENATFPGTTAFVVELPPGALGRSALARHVAAVLALAVG
jgi:murein peptide amidase A